MDHFYQTIRGCFTFAEFYRFVARSALYGGGWHGVEVGALEGQSAACLAVELRNERADCGSMTRLDLVEREHTNCAAIERNLVPVRGIIGAIYAAPSVAVAQHYAASQLDFVMLDAGHTVEDVKADIDAWWPKLREGGILAAHDFGHYFPGVMAAMMDRFAQLNVWRGSLWPDEAVSGQRRVDAEADIRNRSVDGRTSDWMPVAWVHK